MVPRRPEFSGFAFPISNFQNPTVQLQLCVAEDSRTALLAEAAAENTDLLVMGAYAHSRVRELVLGGATRTVLESMTLPVLIAR